MALNFRQYTTTVNISKNVFFRISSVCIALKKARSFVALHKDIFSMKENGLLKSYIYRRFFKGGFYKKNRL